MQLLIHVDGEKIVPDLHPPGPHLLDVVVGFADRANASLHRCFGAHDSPTLRAAGLPATLFTIMSASRGVRTDSLFPAAGHVSHQPS